jgi:hypothetical protein
MSTFLNISLQMGGGYLALGMVRLLCMPIRFEADTSEIYDLCEVIVGYNNPHKVS